LRSYSMLTKQLKHLVLVFFFFFPALAEATPWTSIGPYGGEVHSLVSDNSQNLYTTGSGNGIWELSTGNTAWTRLDTTPFSSGLTSLVIDNAHNTYVGTPNGVWKRAAGQNALVQVDPTFNKVITVLIFDPNNLSDLYAGTQDSGVFKLTAG